MEDLAAYLARIGLAPHELKADLSTLRSVMAAHSRAIAFENLDVVKSMPVSMERKAVERKLVKDGRGGYCWEQNTLLLMALEQLGFNAMPLMCRVRWNKPDDTQEHNTTFTHLALKVDLDEAGCYLADVGFAGTNSIAPVALGSDTPQELPEGQFRVVGGTHPRYSQLQLLIKGEWRGLYEWRDERAAACDMECANWFSCTFPRARFTTSFFVCRVIDGERHHILNADYVVRKGHGVESTVETRQIGGKAELLQLLKEVFGINLDGVDDAGLDRYLAARS